MTRRSVQQQNAERRLGHAVWHRDGAFKRFMRWLGVTW